MPLQPALVLANFRQFAPAEEVSQACVQSRMLLWCRAGKGEIIASGLRLPFAAGDFTFLPWDRSMHYLADLKNPFLVGGIHLIPDHAPDRPVLFEVAHSRKNPLFNQSFRRDCAIPGLEGLVTGKFGPGGALFHFSEFVVHRFVSRDFSENDSRRLAEMLLIEARAAVMNAGSAARNLPVGLEKLILLIEAHPDQRFGLDDLARFSGQSRSTVTRLFRKYFGLSPMDYINRKKIDRAARLLREESFSVAEVGRRVGIDDPFYFSKVFKKWQGVSPLAYHKEKGLL
ncbi:MAG: helix-turn-helix transcriptional regulator [Spirochaetia bacterium]|nr:helix-turn-helix transcriptional regulator [Spirochaetia bacterium]